MTGAVAVVMSGFPRVSETFALGELTALNAAGRLAGLFATKPGNLDAVQPEASHLVSCVQVLAEADARTQAREVVARLEGVPVLGIHGYFAHRPAEVAAHAAALLGVPYSFSAHALDIRRAGADLVGRAAKAACVVTCNHDAATSLRDAGADVTLVPHGVDLARFRPTQATHGGQLRLLAVGRLVEKKGFDVLIEALSLLRTPAELRIIGEGPERPLLEARIAGRGLEGSVRLEGVRTHDELPAAYHWADVVVVPSVVDSAGDRDGLPNVLLEALASGRAVVACDAGAIASAIHDGVTGILVAQRDPAALARAIDRLGERAERERLGRAGRALVIAEHDRERQSARFVEILEHAYA